ncbi:MAG: PHP domain-containing protein [Acidobacteriaceae bacterium]|nr:PHP domain-containing protein [Acidobacteriaceae bacterium]
MSELADSPFLSGFVDLHAHTNESDGSLTPAELVALGKQMDLAALAITDHDTFAGYEKALPHARAAGLDLVRGIELNTRLYVDGGRTHRSVHLLAYFVNGEPSGEFTAWLEDERTERRNRNKALAKVLQANGMEVTFEEVEARGRSLAGRPHFARILVDKGYARSSEEAFRRYLAEDSPTYVARKSKTTEEVIGIVRRANGIPVIAHPIRLGFARDAERELIASFKRAGLVGLEIYHSEHPPLLQAYYHQLAKELELLPTGGSDFHGTVKPDIRLGTGANGNVRVPSEFLKGMRAFAGAE